MVAGKFVISVLIFFHELSFLHASTVFAIYCAHDTVVLVIFLASVVVSFRMFENSFLGRLTDNDQVNIHNPDLLVNPCALSSSVSLWV
jgi:hypothetical protein